MICIRRKKKWYLLIKIFCFLPTKKKICDFAIPLTDYDNTNKNVSAVGYTYWAW